MEILIFKKRDKEMSKLRIRDFNKQTFYAVTKEAFSANNDGDKKNNIYISNNTVRSINYIRFISPEAVILSVTRGKIFTEVVFDPNQPTYSLIKNEEMKYFNSNYCEYGAHSVILGKCYFLEDPETLKKIVEMSSYENLKTMIENDEEGNTSISQYLMRLGYKDTLIYWENVKKSYV